MKKIRKLKLLWAPSHAQVNAPKGSEKLLQYNQWYVLPWKSFLSVRGVSLILFEELKKKLLVLTKPLSIWQKKIRSTISYISDPSCCLWHTAIYLYIYRGKKLAAASRPSADWFGVIGVAGVRSLQTNAGKSLLECKILTSLPASNLQLQILVSPTKLRIWQEMSMLQESWGFQVFMVSMSFWNVLTWIFWKFILYMILISAQTCCTLRAVFAQILPFLEEFIQPHLTPFFNSKKSLRSLNLQAISYETCITLHHFSRRFISIYFHYNTWKSEHNLQL